MAAHKIVQVMVGGGVLVLCNLWLANTVGAQDEVSFIAIRNFLMGDFPESLAVGDFNSDGRPDLAVANAGSDTVSILRGRGNGTFQTAPDVEIVARPSSVAVGDFNGDGRSDLAVASVIGGDASYQ